MHVGVKHGGDLAVSRCDHGYIADHALSRHNQIILGHTGERSLIDRDRGRPLSGRPRDDLGHIIVEGRVCLDQTGQHAQALVLVQCNLCVTHLLLELCDLFAQLLILGLHLVVVLEVIDQMADLVRHD